MAKRNEKKRKELKYSTGHAACFSEFPPVQQERKISEEQKQINRRIHNLKCKSIHSAIKNSVN
jgi:hypothetical protein